MSVRKDNKKYGQYKSRHVGQFEIRTTCLGIVKLHDIGILNNKERDDFLQEPAQIWSNEVLGMMVHKSLCDDVIFCNIEDENSIEPYSKIDNYQREAIYPKTKTTLSGVLDKGQFERRSVCLGIIKIHDRGYIGDSERDHLLDEPFRAWGNSFFGMNIHKDLCADIIHCDLENNNSIEPYKKIHRYQKNTIYLRTKTWMQLGIELRRVKENICSGCKLEYSDSELVAHHIHENYPTLYRESLEDLDTMCILCHDRLHGRLYMLALPNYNAKLNDVYAL